MSIEEHLQNPEDKVLVCIEKDCGKQFIFSKEEQDYFAQPRPDGTVLQTPRRCRECRRKRRILKIQ